MYAPSGIRRLHMSFTDGPPGGDKSIPDVLPPEAREVYRRALLREPVGPHIPGFAQAIELGVLVPDDLEEGVYKPVEPSRVMSKLVAAATRQISEISSFLGRLPTVREDLNKVYRDVREPNQAGLIEHLHGNDLINGRLQEIIDGAEVELITAQPGGPRTRETLDRSMGRDTAALARGISMRTLYHATARFSAFTQEWAAVMAAKGGEIRTLDGPFLRIILVDRTYAFIQDFLPRDTSEPNNEWAHLIKDPAVCAFLIKVFERDWHRADYWYGSDEVKDAVTTPVQRAILRQLSSGRDQSQAARDLGMSLRTLSKHLTALRAKVPHLQSVPQMTYWWATCPDRELD